MTKSPPSLKKFALTLRLDVYPSRFMLVGIATVVVLMLVSILFLGIPNWLKFVLCNMAVFYGCFINRHCNPSISNLRITTTRKCYLSVGIRKIDSRNEDYTHEANITGWRLLLPWLIIINVTTRMGKQFNIPVFHDSVKDEEFRRLAVMFKTG